MMGYATYRVWNTAFGGVAGGLPGTREVAGAGITLYSTQLLLNYIWTPLFFKWNMPKMALADIVLLTLNVGAMAKCYYLVDKTAGYMIVPYLAWLSFASYVCAGVGYLNNWDVRDMTPNVPKKD